MITETELKLIRKQQKEVRDRYKQNHPEGAMDAHRQKKYGITPEQFHSLILKQNNCCAICGKPETIKWRGKIKKLAIDHNHDTGKIRGLLCHFCNVGIGQFRDSLPLLQKAMDYIKLHDS
jgi:hypothetical protein